MKWEMRNSSKLEGTKILLIEDSIDSARFLIIFLRKAGAEVEWFEDALKAIENIELNNPKYDIILSDINLPFMSGLEFCEKIKKLDDYMNVPFIALSGSEDREGKSKEAGFTSHLVKPVKPAKLVTYLESLINS